LFPRKNYDVYCLILISHYLTFVALRPPINFKPFRYRPQCIKTVLYTTHRFLSTKSMFIFYEYICLICVYILNVCLCILRSTHEGDTTMLITRYTSVLIKSTGNTMVSPTYVPPHRWVNFSISIRILWCLINV